MLNTTIIVGRLVAEPEIKEIENEKKVSNITIAVPRSYKNEKGEYDTDFVDCTLWNGIAVNTSEYCKVGDIIGIKGRLETTVYEKDDGTKQKTTRIVADKVSFLSSKEKFNETKKEDINLD